MRASDIILLFGVLIANCSRVSSFEISFNTPVQDQSYDAGATINISLEWTVTTPSFTRIDVFLLAESSTSVSEDVVLNHNINTRSFLYTIPDYLEGNFWMAATRSGTFGVVAIQPPRSSSWGDNTFRIERVFCTNATGGTIGHGYCDAGEYCDRDGDCFDCAFCSSALDAFDGYCPTKCGGSAGYSVGDRIPNVTETEASGGLRDVIGVGSPDYQRLVNNTNAAIVFVPDATGQSNLMTNRLNTKLNVLVSLMQDAVAVFGSSAQLLEVSRAYVFPPSTVNLTTATVSLYNEARAARIALAAGVGGNLSELMRFSQAAGFDWVHYEDTSYLHVSVTQDSCTAPLDLMFLLDASGSIDIPRFGGRPGNFQNKVLGLVETMITYYSIGMSVNDTRVGVVTFSDETHLRIPLNGYSTAESLTSAVQAIEYSGGATYTSAGLHRIRTEMMTDANGLRPLSAGVSRVLIVVTDGQATPGYEGANESGLIQAENVNVFTMGVGANIGLAELQSMASNNDSVYLLKSFSQIVDVVNSVSARACDAPAIVTAGNQTDTDIDEYRIKYFRPACGVVNGTRLRLTVTTLTGNVYVYVSLSSNYPGPFDYNYTVQNNETTKTITIQSTPDTVGKDVVVAIKGIGSGRSTYTLDVWTDIFNGVAGASRTVSETIGAGTEIYTPPVTESGFTYSIVSGNTDGAFAIDAVTGAVSVGSNGLDYETTSRFTLRISGQSETLACMSGFLDLMVDVTDVNDNAPTFVGLPGVIFIAENTSINTPVLTVVATDPDGSITYSLTEGSSITRRSVTPHFRINATSGVVYTQDTFDSETQPFYVVTVFASDNGIPTPMVVNATVMASISPVLCPTGTFSDSGTYPCSTTGVCTYPAEYESVAATASTDRVCLSASQPCSLGDAYETAPLTPTSNRVCTPQPVCSATQWESTAPTVTSARECTLLTVCTSTQYASVVATGVSDRTCSNVTTCASGTQYQTAAPTSTTDRLCDALTTCSGTQYEELAPSPVSDRTCSDLTICTSDEFASTLATATTDQTCTSAHNCTASEFESTALTATSDRGCTSIDVCTGTEFELNAPTATTDRMCVALAVCSAVQYKTAFATATSDRMCGNLTACAGYQYVSTPPTATTDRGCDNITTCLASQYETEAPTASTDRACVGLTPCTSSEFESTAASATSDRECTAIRSCTALEYETGAPTATTDRICATLAVCNASQYRSVASTATSDRTCVDLTTCTAAQFESVAATATSNRFCTQLRTCSGIEFESQVPTAFTDRDCDFLTNCTASEYQTVAHTVSSDRQCGAVASCTSAQYESAAPTATTNRACNTTNICALATQYEVTAPTPTSNRVCASTTACDSDQYESASQTASSDRECSTISAACTAEQYEAAAATATSDRTCVALTVCNFASTFISATHTSTTDRSCGNLTTCAVASDGTGTYQTVVPTHTTDRQCAGVTPCTSTQYQTSMATVLANTGCEWMSNCTASQYESVASTATTDRQCAARTVCTAAQYEVVAVTPTSDRACASLRSCSSATQYELLSATATSNRQCGNVTECGSQQYTSAARTSTSDRTCTNLTVCSGDQYELTAHSSTSDRVCANVTGCTASQYELIAPTASTDRDCDAIAVCASTAYESVAPTATTNRECEGVHTCTGLEYETAAPTATTDRSCATLSVCTASQYTAALSTSTSDRTCANLTVCGMNANGTGTYQTVAETGSSDRLCASLQQCTSLQYEATPPGPAVDRVCESITSCSSTQFASTASTATSDAICSSLTVCASDAYENVTSTASSDRACATLSSCNPLIQYETIAPTATSNRFCDTLITCVPFMEYETTAPTATTNRNCDILDICGTAFGTYESVGATATTNRECESLEVCTTGQFQSVAATATSDRVCEKVSTCLATEFLSDAATATSDVSCTALSICGPLANNAGGTYISEAQTPTTDRQCKSLTVCGKDEFISLEATLTSDRICKNLTVCEENVEEIQVPATATTDRVCGTLFLNQDAEGSNAEPSNSMSSAVMGTVVAAVLLMIILLVLLVGIARKKTDEKDLEMVDDFTISPITAGQSWHKGDGEGKNIYPMAGVFVPGADENDSGSLAQRGDRLWNDFRRCTSFDHMYFGNALMQTPDGALEDIYAILSMSCPPRSFFGHLRSVGDRFAQQEVDLEETIDDVVDFLCCAMPDVLMERTIDLCAMHDESSAYSEEELYALVDDDVPSNNPFFAFTEGAGFGLMDCAAARELKRVDPIYFEADEDGANIYGNYSAVADGFTRESEYAQASSLDDMEDMYDMGSANVYAATNPGALIYDTASGSASPNTGCIYDNQMGGDAIYDGMQNGMGDGIYGAADSEELYALANAGGAAEEPVYGFASNTTDESQVIYDNNGALGPGSAVGGADGAIYGNPDLRDDDDGAVYDNNARDDIAGLDGEIYDNNSDLTRIESIYGNGSTDDSPVKTLERPEYDAGDGAESGAVYDNKFNLEPPLETRRSTRRQTVFAPPEESTVDTMRERSNSYAAALDSDALDDSGEISIVDLERKMSITSLDVANLESDFLEMEKDGISDRFGRVVDLDAGYLPVND
eukprot:m.1547738 g.1547738  ORF g.1547738 m.1547738 type:complete len:2579 (-) comp25261_c0_seq2:183-7919(-)